MQIEANQEEWQRNFVKKLAQLNLRLIIVYMIYVSDIVSASQVRQHQTLQKLTVPVLNRST